jgi:hypothetical protein
MIRGLCKWAKITDPVLTYDKTDKEWTFDLLVDKETKKTLSSLGCASQIKVNKEGDDVIKFSRRVTKKDPLDPNKRVPSTPLRVVDRAGQPWDNSKKVGNGSTLNVQFAVNPKQTGGNKANVIAVQVWEHVEYEGGGDREEFPIDASGQEDWS